MNDLSILIPNYSVRENSDCSQIIECVKRITKYYPDLNILIVNDYSVNGYEPLKNTNFNGRIIEFPLWKVYEKNDKIPAREAVWHSLVLDYGMRRLFTKYVLIMDQDMLIKKKGFVEKLYGEIKRDNVMGAGTSMLVCQKIGIPTYPIRFSMWDAEFFEDFLLSMQGFEDPSGGKWHAGALAQLKIQQSGYKTKIIGGAEEYLTHLNDPGSR